MRFWLALEALAIGVGVAALRLVPRPAAVAPRHIVALEWQPPWWVDAAYNIYLIVLGGTALLMAGHMAWMFFKRRRRW